MIQKGDKKTMNRWAFYDWANSVYPLVISTAIFPIFYSTVTSTHNANGDVISDMVTFFGYEMHNTVVYEYVVAASFLLVCILSPLLSGVADYSGSKKRFLQFFCYLGAIATAGLYFFNPEHLELSMVALFLGSLGFWNSLVFYNAYLPEVAHTDQQDKLSAKGFSLGYAGASILLIICLIAIQMFEMPAKYAFLLTGIWWIGFSQITYSVLPNSQSKNKITGRIMGDGFRELKKVGNFILTTKRLKRYLYSFFLFSMGVQTVMLIAVLFAKKEVFTGENANDAGLIIAVLIIQFIAIPGAFTFSWAAKKIGNIKTLAIALFIWSLCCTYAFLFVYDEINFYILAAVVGFVMGGTQSLSRSTYSKFLPETKDTASFFSFYDITEKVGIVIGMVSVGLLESAFGSMRTSVLALIAFFVLGFIALFFIPKNEERGSMIPPDDPLDPGIEADLIDA
jgi:UMF1 family MFS transporter